ncbi:hypothetical protein Pan216_05840 [Planctomycetes bacterium Pan216]|uniref:Uncharacterized protein n=1 Tax=Kolteria novifilia TaxID=2527975 RepID=A0A518AYF1_9BACT|nr:hypothetical protein Pan216_05840 [Planctomycetes bacterium Pan216]
MSRLLPFMTIAGLLLLATLSASQENEITPDEQEAIRVTLVLWGGLAIAGILLMAFGLFTFVRRAGRRLVDKGDEEKKPIKYVDLRAEVTQGDDDTVYDDDGANDPNEKDSDDD